MENGSDQEYIIQSVDKENHLGGLRYDISIKESERSGKELDLRQIFSRNQELFEKVKSVVQNTDICYNQRLEKLYKAHHTYVSQKYIKDRFGDLGSQADPSFDFDKYVKSLNL